MSQLDTKTLEWVTIFLQIDMATASEKRKVRRQFGKWCSDMASMGMLKEFRDLLYEERNKPRLFGNEVFLNWQINTIGNEMKARNGEKHPRPEALIETEKTKKGSLTARVKKGDPGAVLAKQEYERQLGELGFEYGEMIYQIEELIRRGEVTKIKEAVGEDAPVDTWYAIDTEWADFSRPFRADVKRAIFKALDKNQYAKVRHYHYNEIDKRTYFKDMPFVSALFEGDVDTKPSDIKPDAVSGTLARLKSRTHNPKYIKLRVHAKVFDGIYAVYQEKAKELSGNGRRFLQFRDKIPKEIREVAMPALKSRLEEAKPERWIAEEEVRAMILKANYRDEMRVLAEWMLQIHDDGKKARRKDYFDMDLEDVVASLYPGYRMEARVIPRILADGHICVVALQRWIAEINDVAVVWSEKKLRVFLQG